MACHSRESGNDTIKITIMSITKLKKTASDKTYQKHHSFENFCTNIQADVGKQAGRVVKILKAMDCEERFKEILSKALIDLETIDQDTDFKITQHIADELTKIDDDNVARYVYHRYRYDVYPKQRKLDAYPPYLQIEPTSICNYRCVFCYQTDASFTKKANGMMGSMTFEMFKDVIDQVQGHVEFFSLASRGEPLICKDIDKMLEYCTGKFLGLKINTNASMLTEKHCHAILSGGVNTLVFSADAAVEPLYSQLRVKGDLNKVLTNIHRFNEIKKKQYPDSKLITRVSGVKVNDAQNMDSMYEMWGELVDQIAFVVYNPWENVYQVKPNNVTAPCSDLWRRMFVWYDGKVNPCDTDFKSVLLAGNINQKSVSEIWQDENYQLLREQHLNAKRCDVYPCKGCVVV